MFSMILALDKNDLLANTNKQNGLAWHYPDDLTYFKKMTLNKICIMGHNTYKYLKKPLANRINIIISNDTNLHIKNAYVVNNVDNLITKLKDLDQEIMVIGGKQIFNLFFPYINRIYLTRINKTYEGDIYYHLNLDNFKLINKREGEDKDLKFLIYER